MGCDIHTYVEYSDFTKSDGKPYWRGFTKNGGSRDYVMFGVLAGVRVPDAQLFEPKGMPEGELSYNTADDYWLNVAPASNPEWADDEDWTSIESATSWVESGYSIGERNADGRLAKVSGPDWHSHSWLTADELRRALDHYLVVYAKLWPEEAVKVPAEWSAMLAAMESFEANGCATRLVFWFDN